jgi:hypothetical protein
MKRLIVAAVLVVAIVSGCGRPSDEAGDTRVDPVKVVRTNNTTQLTLTSQAAGRLDIHRVRVGRDGNRTVVPYAAVLYTADGRTWVFRADGKLRFVRIAVVVDDVRGDNVVLRSGLPAGTTVVTTGAAELLGAESGVGEA